MTDEQRRNMSLNERARKIKGPKYFLAGHMTYATMIWTMKLCMLLFCQRLTRGLKSEKFIKPAIAFVAATWLVEMLTGLQLRRTVSNNWAIYPNPGKICTHESPTWYIIQVVFNILTDAVLVSIPMPLVIKANITEPPGSKFAGSECAIRVQHSVAVTSEKTLDKDRERWTPEFERP